MGSSEFNLTIQQENIWLIEKLYNNTNINNITEIFSIKQLLDLKIMSQVMNKIIENNDSFRLRIRESKGNPSQYLYKYEHEEIPIIENSKIEVDMYKIVITL